MKKLLTYLLFFCFGMIFSQEKDRALPKGNDAFAEKAFADAEAQYRISEFKSPRKASAAYNLGNAIYRQNQKSEAGLAFKKAIQKAKTYQEKHRAYHNLGNVLMAEKNYEGAVEAYKNALRNDPNDEETRYNYALAKEYLKNNPKPKDDKNKDKKNDKKDNKDNKDKKDQKDKNQDKKDDKGQKDQKKDDQKKDQGDKGDKKDEKPKPAPGGISKQRLENLLDAVNNEEKKVQQKVNAKKVKAPPVKTEKDW